MEKLKNLARAFRTDPGNLADAGDFLQPRFTNVLFAQLAVRADHETMRLVAQPLNKVQHRVARLQLDRLLVRHEQGFAAGVAVRALGDRQQLHLRQPEPVEYLLDGVELAAAAIDDDKIGPLWKRIVVLGPG